MFSIGNIETLLKLGNALANGDDNIISKLVEDKLESLSHHFLTGLIPGDFGPLARAQRALDTGGASELQRLRGQLLSAVTPPSLPGSGTLNRIQNAFTRNMHLLSRPSGKWQVWSKSRQEWLDRSYRHDWRTQPRDWRGRWTRGRLRHPYMTKSTKRAQRVRRRIVRQAARAAIKPPNWQQGRSSWLNGN